ncbi:LysR family transcriptional regulator [Veronia pacifica]|uniref:LysR family transcriptional regulator n=2 Tax=Veronia pacifica TaxID=1080227 RepID=A0A1C3EG31_9GAMM|nr:LysR family transcriptional regulator [Veronia pacifica]
MAVFAAVVNTGSFNKAATLLGISRPAVSEQIRKLEELVKVRVLQRSTRTLSVTPDGEKILPLAQSVLESLVMTDKVLSQDELRGKIRLSTTYDIANKWLLKRINEFSTQYPFIEFDFLISDDRVDMIKSRVDLAIRVSAMDEMGFVARKLFDDELEVYAAPSYLDTLNEPVTTENLLSQRWILISNLKNGGELVLQRQSEILRFSPVNFFETNSPVFAKDMVFSGMGLGLLINHITRDCVEAGKLVKILPGWKARQFSCYLLYPSRSYLPRRMQIFINFLMNSK